VIGRASGCLAGHLDVVPVALDADALAADGIRRSQRRARPRERIEHESLAEGQHGRTTWRRTPAASAMDAGAMPRSLRGVGCEAMTSPKGRPVPGGETRQYPNVLKLSCTALKRMAQDHPGLEHRSGITLTSQIPHARFRPVAPAGHHERER